MGTHRPIDLPSATDRITARLRPQRTAKTDERQRALGATDAIGAGGNLRPSPTATPLVVLDVNNFFSPTGGGVRRYHLEKIAHFGKRADIQYHLVVPSDRRLRERKDGATLHHMPAVPIGRSGYRFLIDPFALRNLVRELDPDVIEIGSPYILPDLVRFAAKGSRAQLVGFWHAHYPDAYLRRPLAAVGDIGALAERVGWWWARRTFGRFDRIVAAAQCLEGELAAHGIDRVAITPLGVDLGLFSPSCRDEGLRARWGASNDDVVFAFPHRLCEEKRLNTLIEAWPHAVAAIGPRAKLVFAGRGPGEAQVRALMARYPTQVFHEGFLSDPIEIARLLASVDVVAALSPTETFGLSAAEAMASGSAIIGSDELSVGEMLRQSHAGIAVADRDPVALAKAMVALGDARLVRRLGQRAHGYALSRFDWRETFDRLANIYRAVCDGSTMPTMEPWSPIVAALASSGEFTFPAPGDRTGRPQWHQDPPALPSVARSSDVAS